MNKINGIDIKAYLPSFQWIADIQYYEGSLLSEYKTDKGEIYAFLWCDSNESCNRWLASKSTKRALYGLNAGIFSIRNFFEEQTLDDSVYVLDIGANSCIENATLVKLTEVASQYLPDAEVFIAAELRPKNEHYALLIDGNWSTSALAEIPKKFIELCNLVQKHTIDVLNHANKSISNAPWKGGFSALHFFADLNKHSNIGINEIQYASPGYVQFDANSDIGVKVSQEIDAFISHQAMINKIYSEIGKYLKANKLNSEEAQLDKHHLDWLGNYGCLLMENFSELSWAWLQSNTENTFVAIKIARAYVKRIRDIADYVKNDKIILPKL